MSEPQPDIAELVAYIVRHIVDDPDQVEIREVEGRRLTVYEVVVADRDRGKVIGRQGQVANALRSVAKAAAARAHLQVAVEIVT